MDDFTIDMHSAERAWPPFVTWLQAHGIVWARAITVHPNRMTCDVTVTKTRKGKHYVENGNIATEVRHDMHITSLPPRR